MKKVIPEKTMYFCDLCNKEMVDYVDYKNSCRLKIIHTRKRELFSFFKKEAKEFHSKGKGELISYDIRKREYP